MAAKTIIVVGRSPMIRKQLRKASNLVRSSRVMAKSKITAEKGERRVIVHVHGSVRAYH